MKTQPQYLKLTQDIVFKTFFSRNNQVLISLLKAFLPISDEAVDVVILNPEEEKQALSLKDPSLLPDTPDRKRMVLDLNVKLAGGEHINVEMQSTRKQHFLDRVLLYWARLHGQSLKRGDDYGKINPTYSLVFADFSVFGEEVLASYINEIMLRVNNSRVLLSLGLRIVVVELDKLNKSCAELIDLRERWCYFIKHGHELTESQRSELAKEAEMKAAIDHLSEITQDERLYWDALSREKYEVADRLERKGLLEEGIEKGRAEGMRQVALNMLNKGFELSVISEATGLSEAEINRLKK